MSPHRSSPHHSSVQTTDIVPATPLSTNARSGRKITWDAIKSTTCDVLERKLSYLLEHTRRQLLTAHPLTIDPHDSKNHVAIYTSYRRNMSWDNVICVAVEADNPFNKNADYVELERAYPPSGNRLTFKKTPELLEFCQKTPIIHIALVDSFEIQATQALLTAMQENARNAPLLTALWNRQPSVPSQPVSCIPPDGNWNAEQEKMRQAIEQGGGWFFWGPPGTGKTHVIKRAVMEALNKKQSILIASHTHVAVDNVIEDFLEYTQGVHPRLSPGQLVRCGKHEDVSQKIAEAPWLMLDKAAAYLTRYHERKEKLDKEYNSNISHPDRADYQTVIEQYDNCDHDGIKEAYAAVAAEEKNEQLLRIIEEHQSTQGTLLLTYSSNEQLIREHEHTVDTIAELDNQAAQIRKDIDTTTANIDSLNAKILELSAFRTEVEKKNQHLHTSWKRNFSHYSTQINNNNATLASLHAEITQYITQVSYYQSRRAELEQSLSALHERIAAAADNARLYHECIAENRDIDAQLARLTQRIATIEDEYNANHILLLKIPRPRERLIELNAEEYSMLAQRRKELHKRVEKLDTARESIQKNLKKLEDLYRTTQSELLSGNAAQGAQLVATTLHSLTTKRELVNRKFDIVIIDEMSSAYIPYLIFAGSKAKHAVAFVGDFLQNAPISAINDPVDDYEKLLWPWQTADLFALHHITDRRTAQEHPCCLSLCSQYRYPDIITTTVNSFCYDGLLRTGTAPRTIHPAVIFIDTHNDPREGLKNTKGSWYNPLGLELLPHIYHDIENLSDHWNREISPDGQDNIHPLATRGLVTPYRNHADSAQTLSNKSGWTLECGTSHRFQGRQFDAVVLDLCQDNSPRWVANADIHGNHTSKSAARLLNVALTRTKKRIYIIGNWSFINRSRSPGLRAIAALADHEDFTLISSDSLTRP